MPLIRPEAQAAVRRWREAILGALVLALGVYWAFGHGLLALIGWPVAVFGGALVFVGTQRAVFRQDGGGEGVVRMVEGQLGYFGPQTGGIVSIGEIRRLSRRGNRWVIDAQDGTRLEIPVDAEGSEVLFDVFSMLPGLDMGLIVKSARKRTSRSQVLWQRPDLRLH